MVGRRIRVAGAALPDGGTGALADLMSTVSDLWPGADIALSRRRHVAPGAAALVPVPGSGRPRALVPDDGRAAAGALRRYSSALGPREGVARALGAVVVRAVGPARLAGGGRIVIRDDGDGSLGAHLAGVLGEPVRIAVTIGTERVNRKPVVQAFDARGRTLAFAKVGLSPDSAPHLLREADALRRVHGAVPGIETPGLVAQTTWRGHPVVTMTALRSRLPRRGDALAPSAEMDAFSRAFDGGYMPLTAVPQWRRVSASLRAASDPRPADLVAAVERAAPDTLETGAWHGDWTPWNMARGARGGLQLWDFERFETDVVRGLDRFHHCVNLAVRAAGPDEAAVTRGMEQALRGVGDAHAAHTVGAVYLAAIIERYLLQATSASGHLVGSRLNACIMALSAWLARTGHLRGD